MSHYESQCCYETCSVNTHDCTGGKTERSTNTEININNFESECCYHTCASSSQQCDDGYIKQSTSLEFADFKSDCCVENPKFVGTTKINNFI